jgi:hypothetical protein
VHCKQCSSNIFTASLLQSLITPLYNQLKTQIKKKWKMRLENGNIKPRNPIQRLCKLWQRPFHYSKKNEHLRNTQCCWHRKNKAVNSEDVDDKSPLPHLGWQFPRVSLSDTLTLFHTYNASLAWQDQLERELLLLCQTRPTKQTSVLSYFKK